MKTHRLMLIAGLCGFFIASIAILFLFRSILAPFLIAYVLQLALKPFVNMLTVRDVSHSTAVIMVFSGTFLLLAILLALSFPLFTREIASMQDNIDDYTLIITQKYQELQQFLHGGDAVFGKLMGGRSFGEEITSYINTALTSMLKGITQNLFGLIGLFINLSVIPFATFFFLYEDQRIKKKLISMVPNRFFEVTLHLLHSLNIQVGLILRGMLISVVAISIISTIGLMIIGLDYPIVIGIFAGVSNLIPYFGSVAGALAACIVAILTGQPLMFFVPIVIVFLIVNIIDNTLVQPIVLSKAANLHPLIIIFLVLAGSQFGGIMGMLLAIPFASLFQIIGSVIIGELRRPIRPPFSQYIERSTDHCS
jgi:putative permease